MKAKELQVFKNKLCLVIGKISKVIHYYRKQQIYRGMSIGKSLWNDISEVVELLNLYIEDINAESSVVRLEEILLVLQNLQVAQEQENYVFLSDLYEFQFLPMLISIQERLVTMLGIQIDEEVLQKNIATCSLRNPQLLYSIFPKELINMCNKGSVLSDTVIEQVTKRIEKCVENGCGVDITSSGFYTMVVQDNASTQYLHTNGNIVQEAVIQAEEWLLQGKEEYIFYGLGMGYLYQEMFEMDWNISIKVIETNRDLLLLAMVFAPLFLLLEKEEFELVYDPTGHELEKVGLCIDDRRGFYIFRPALSGIKKEHIRKQLESYFVNESSIRIHSRAMLGNFKKNSRLKCYNIQELEKKFRGKEVIIVAAGPSLDKNMKFLKDKRNDTIILAAGTVLKKLLNEGIRPDYVIIIDSGRPTYCQIEGIEDCGVPLVFLSTVFSYIPKNYQGEKYMLCQKGFREAEMLAEAGGYFCVESGGSVMTTALDLCLKLLVKKIIFVGLDLAYTDGMDHAADTAYREKVVKKTEIMVNCVTGGKVETGKNLKIYLDWIESRLQRRTEREAKIPIIDATEGGALKRGMLSMTLKQALQEL